LSPPLDVVAGAAFSFSLVISFCKPTEVQKK